MSSSTARPGRKRRWWILLVTGLVVAAAVAVAVGSSASDDDPEGRTLRFSERNSETVLTTTTGAGSPTSQGDVAALTTPLLDAAGARVGRVHWTCVTTVGGPNFDSSTNTCHGAFVLRDGTLTMQFNVSPSDHSAGIINAAITGGTGAYAGARGVVVSKSREDKDGRDDTITLVD